MENKCLLKYLFDLNHVNHWNPKNNDSSQMTNAAEKKMQILLKQQMCLLKVFLPLKPKQSSINLNRKRRQPTKTSKSLHFS